MKNWLIAFGALFLLGGSLVHAQVSWLEATNADLAPGSPIKASQIKEIRDAIKWGGSGSNVYRTTGNVGIGTASPAAKLDVRGGVKAGREGYAGTYSSLQTQGIWSIAQNYKINTTANSFGNQYGLGYSYNTVGGGISGWSHQVHFLNNGVRNATISLATGRIATTGICDKNGGNCTTPAAIVGLVSAGGPDNLGNHTATTTVNMNAQLLNNVGKIQVSGVGGNSNTAHSSYALYQESGGWTHPYPDLMIRHHTGISYDAYSAYGGHRFFTGAPNSAGATGLQMQVTDKVYIVGNVGIGTASPSQKLHVVGNSYLQGTVYLGSTDTALFRDAANRIATDDNFYVRPASPATYLYSTNTYLGNTSGDATHLRGNNFTWNQGTIQGNGNVGIGTTAPGHKLHVVGNAYATGELRTDARTVRFGTSQYLHGDSSSALYHNSNHSTITQLIMRDAQSTIYGRLYGDGNASSFGLLDKDGHWGVRMAADSHVELRDNNEVTFSAGQGGVTGNYGTVQTGGGGKGGYEGYSINGWEVFMTNAANSSVGIYNDALNRWRMLWSTANFSIYQYNGEYILHGAINSYTYLYYNGAWKFRTENTGARTNGTHYANAFAYLSDRNFKSGVKTISGLETIKKLRGVNFTWKDSGEASVGLIAQEVEEVLPELVTTDEDGYKSVQYGNLVAPLIEAVKEQQTQIEAQQAQIDELRSLIESSR